MDCLRCVNHTTRASRIETASGGPRLPCDERSVSLARENSCEYAGAPAQSAKAGVARSPRLEAPAAGTATRREALRRGAEFLQSQVAFRQNEPKFSNVSSRP